MCDTCSEMGFELLRRHYQEMNVDFKAMEGHTGEVVHKAEVEKLLLELQDGKVCVCVWWGRGGQGT